VTPLSEPQTVEAAALGTASLPAEDKGALLDFQRETAALQRAVLGSIRAVEEAASRLDYIARAILQSPRAEDALLRRPGRSRSRLHAIDVALSGDSTIRIASGVDPAFHRRPGGRRGLGPLDVDVGSHRDTARGLSRRGAAFEPVLGNLQRLLEDDLPALEAKLDDAGAPWTPGRIPRWRRPRE